MKVFIAVVIAYLIGSISTAYIIGRAKGGLDIRQYGSGNAGATNVARVLGFRSGIITLILDFLKGIIAVLVGYWLNGAWGASAAGMAVIAGHNWPIYFQFKGGKGVATALGAALVLSPIIGIILLLIAGIIIFLTRYVSLGSIIAAALYPVLVFIMQPDLWLVIFSIFAGAIIVIRHRGNIKRLMNGTESKFGEMVKKV